MAVRACFLLLACLAPAALVVGCQSRGGEAPPSIDEASMRPNGSRQLSVVFLDGVPVPVASISALAGMAPPPPPGPGAQVAEPPPTPASVRWTVPEGWVATPPSSQMRAAQYTIRRAQGDASDAELAVFYFGPQGAGDAGETLDRWASAFTSAAAPPQKSRLDRAQVLEVRGTYGGDHVMGAAAPAAKSDWGLLGAVVQTPLGPYYFKMLGPARTIDAARDGFLAMVRSVGMGDAPAGSASVQPAVPAGSASAK